jgi:hypothetical protein
MNSVLDSVLVGIALIVSAAYAVSSLGPKSFRRRVLGALGRAAARAPDFLRLRRAAQWLATASAGDAKGACGGCDSCGSGQAHAQQSSEPEVTVPLAKIGRRNAAAVKSPEAAGSDLL